MKTKVVFSFLLSVLSLTACDVSEGCLRNGSSSLSARVAATTVTPVDQVQATLVVSGTPSSSSHAYVKSQDISLGTVPYGATYSVALEGKISTINGYASRWWASSVSSTAANPVETVTLQFVDGPTAPQASYDSLKVAGHLLLPASTKYTLDGKDPRTSSTAISASGSLTLISTGTIQAATYSQSVASTGQPVLWSDVSSWAVTASGTTLTANSPTFTPAAGSYSSAQSVTLSTTTAGATIYYTTDGSAPTTSSLVFSGTIPVSTSTTIKAIAVKASMTNSSASTATYTINIASGNSFTDSRDNQVYAVIKIGTQTWMAQNLNYVTSGSRAYKLSTDSAAKYGQLYDWNTATSACPTGWHLPSDAEWIQLENAVGGSATAGTALKATSGWAGGNGKNTSGFNGLPGGYYNSYDGSTGSGQYAVWWTSTESESGYTAYTRMLNYSIIGSSSTYFFAGNESGTYNSVRCVK